MVWYGTVARAISVESQGLELAHARSTHTKTPQTQEHSHTTRLSSSPARARWARGGGEERSLQKVGPLAENGGRSVPRRAEQAGPQPGHEGDVKALHLPLLGAVEVRAA